MGTWNLEGSGYQCTLPPHHALSVISVFSVAPWCRSEHRAMLFVFTMLLPGDRHHTLRWR